LSVFLGRMQQLCMRIVIYSVAGLDEFPQEF